MWNTTKTAREKIVVKVCKCMGRGWLTKEQVDEIVASYRETNSIIKTMEELNLSEVKVRRVLITEGLWSSRTSEKIGALKRDGMSTDEIADRLHMSVKNVQAYMPYENGAYGADTKNAYGSRRSRNKARGKNRGKILWMKPK